MDIQTALIGVAVFLLSAGILLIISMCGIKEKSYEEALAEQRQQANALLGTQHRAKPKDKKIKKANKKIKEKQSSVSADSETTEESDDKSPTIPSSAVNVHHKLHVEFKEPATQSPSQPQTNKKRGKKDKVRSILIHTSVENAVVNQPEDVPHSNHFEQLHPKDDLELMHLHLHAKEDIPVKSESAKEKAQKPKQNVVQEGKDKANKPRQNSQEGKETKPKPQEVAKEKVNKEKINREKVNKEKPSNVSPETQQKSKKVPEKIVPVPKITKKEEPPVEAVVVAAQSNGYITNTSKEKKKKKAEHKIIQEIAAKDGDINLPLLLNVVRKAELSRSEVQILIDLLLNKQHEAPAVVDQWSEGKADPVQKLKKQLAEKEKTLVEEQEALQGVQAKLREVRAEQATEKLQLQKRNKGLEEALQAKHLELQTASSRVHSQTQKMQQMHAQINEEGIAIRKLREEITALQLQRQQIDIHIAQSQEAEATIQDLQARNNQLTMELHSVSEQNMATKDHQQGIIVQLQHQVGLYKNEVDEKENYERQFEELRRDLEHRLGSALRAENELKVEMGQLKSACQQNAEEVRRLEHGKGQALEEIRNLQKQKDELDHSLSQVKAELRDVQEEKSELQQIKANGVAQENQIHKEELLNLHNELSSIKSELHFVETKYITDLDASNKAVARLQTELDEQKNKNNELRKKNWKVIEALKAAENKTLDSVSPTVNVDEIVSKVRTEEQDLHRRFIQRLFPDMPFSVDLSSDQWYESVEKTIKKYISDLENLKLQENQGEITKLQAQVKHYKNIIDDTEGILKKLQNHIEQEEIQWRNELRKKEAEIEALKQRHLSELQMKVEQLELRIKSEQSEKIKLGDEFERLKSRTSSMVEKTIVDQLSEEVNLLKEEIIVEQKKNLELSKLAEDRSSELIIKEQNINSSNGPSIDTPAV